jgi:NADPH:quinone reductase-like Zn-dependent oxidoreductase
VSFRCVKKKKKKQHRRELSSEMRSFMLATLAVGTQALRITLAPRMCESAAPAASPLFSRRNLLAGGAAAAVGATGLQLLKPSTPLFLPAASSMAGQTVVITGANTGLGFESALRLAAAGARVVVTARTAAKAQSAVEALRAKLGESGAGAQFVALPLDLANLASVAAFPAELQRALGDGVAVDVLLNNAGVMVRQT